MKLDEEELKHLHNEELRVRFEPLTSGFVLISQSNSASDLL